MLRPTEPGYYWVKGLDCGLFENWVNGWLVVLVQEQLIGPRMVELLATAAGWECTVLEWQRGDEAPPGETWVKVDPPAMEGTDAHPSHPRAQ